MRKKIAGFGIPLFFIFPVLGFCSVLFNYRNKSSATIYVLFTMLLGYSISFSDSSADSYRYARAFINFDNTLNYNTILSLYLNGELRDLYRLLLFYFVSIFTNNPKVMYAFAGLVYGILSYLSLRVLIKERGERFDFYTFVLALVFFTYVSLSSLNGFRFNTGALLFFLSTYFFIIQKKNVWGIGLLLTPLFHYGFLLAVPVIFSYKIVELFLSKKNEVNKILFIIFLITYLMSWFLKLNSINLGFLNESEVISDAVGQRLNYVNSSDVASLVENRKENSTFLSVQKFFDYGIKIYILIVIVFLRKLYKKTAMNDTFLKALFSFVLFYYSFCFIATSFPSGSRFLNIGHLFFVILLIKFYSYNKKKSLKKIILFALPVFSFSILFINFMLPLLILSPTFWYGNVFWIIIEGLNFS